MGNVESLLGPLSPLAGAMQGTKKEPPKVVLVPPMFERDVRGRSRMAKNAYDYLFSKRNMRWLFNDYMGALGPRATLYMTPPADESLSVRAKIGLVTSSMTLRYQPLGPDQPHAFFEVKAKPEGFGPPQVDARACFFDPESGWGAFAVAPMAHGSKTHSPTVGVRYSSPVFTAGAAFAPAPAPGAITSAWLVSRLKGVTFGYKLLPDAPGLSLGAVPPGSGQLGETLQRGQQWLMSNGSLAVAYTPPGGVAGGAAGRNSFTACLELVRGAALVTSFHQHLAITRQVLNPLEKDDVVGITNYVDLGIKLVAPLSASVDSATVVPSDVPSSSAAEARPSTAAPLPEGLEPGLNFAVSWQANKNWMVKARVGSASAAAAVGMRAWFHPSFLLFGSVQYNYAGWGGTSGGSYGAAPSWTRVGDLPLRWGLVLQIENFGAMRYERGSQERRGRALLQRHEASDMDVSNAEGTGRWVVKQAGLQDYNTPVQETDTTAEFL